MLSVAQSAPVPTVDQSFVAEKESVKLNELGTVQDAIQTISRSIVASGAHSVRLHCTIPTWCPSSDTCLDLHDLNDLRSRALLFIHALTESLRSAGISASYRLAPCNSALCLVYPLSPEHDVNKVKSSAMRALQNAKSTEREKVLLADLEHGPALIIT